MTIQLNMAETLPGVVLLAQRVGEAKINELAFVFAHQFHDIGDGFCHSEISCESGIGGAAGRRNARTGQRAIKRSIVPRACAVR